jgi:hypothetical protein
MGYLRRGRRISDERFMMFSRRWVLMVLTSSQCQGNFAKQIVGGRLGRVQDTMTLMFVSRYQQNANSIIDCTTLL